MTEPTNVEMNRFVKEVDEFMQKYAKLTSPDMQQKVYDAGDPVLMNDYKSAVNRATMLKNTIEATTGAWASAKKAYASVTDVTSMWIGDAVDEIRSWFTDNNVQGLGVLQLPAAAWVAGIVASAYIMNSLMSKIFVRVDVARLVAQGVDPAQALQTAQSAAAPAFFEALNIPLLIGGGLAVWLLLRN